MNDIHDALRSVHMNDIHDALRSVHMTALRGALGAGENLEALTKYVTL